MRVEEVQDLMNAGARAVLSTIDNLPCVHYLVVAVQYISFQTAKFRLGFIEATRVL